MNLAQLPKLLHRKLSKDTSIIRALRNTKTEKSWDAEYSKTYAENAINCNATEITKGQEED